MIIQVSVFLENKPGRLEKVLQILYDNEIDIRSISVAETLDYGVFRLILDKPALGVEKLKDAGFTVKETSVLGLEIVDERGSMLKVVKELAVNDIDIEYTYSCLPINEDKVIIIVRVDDIEKAMAVLKDSRSCRLLSCEDMGC
ncbi:MAG TPA: ACT domain-containing protein [Tissierellaceae bacterium]|nr:ACT domain-containing protein [Tissierellaceae bacterium]